MGGVGGTMPTARRTSCIVASGMLCIVTPGTGGERGTFAAVAGAFGVRSRKRTLAAGGGWGAGGVDIGRAETMFSAADALSAVAEALSAAAEALVSAAGALVSAAGAVAAVADALAATATIAPAAGKTTSASVEIASAAGEMAAGCGLRTGATMQRCCVVPTGCGRGEDACGTTHFVHRGTGRKA